MSKKDDLLKQILKKLEMRFIFILPIRVITVLNVIVIVFFNIPAIVTFVILYRWIQEENKVLTGLTVEPDWNMSCTVC